MYVHKLMELIDQMIYASQILVDIMKLFSEKYCLYPFHSTNNEWQYCSSMFLPVRYIIKLFNMAYVIGEKWHLLILTCILQKLVI